MKTMKTLVVGLAFLALIGYGAFTTIQLRQLQTRVTVLEQSQLTASTLSQERVAQLHESVRTLQQEQKKPHPRFLSQNENR